MRTLLSFAGGSGHLDPLLPVARALAAAGHEVAVRGSAEHVFRARENGLEPLVEPVDPQPDQPIQPLVPLDLDNEFAVIAEHFAGSAALRAAEATTRAIREWRPELVVCDELDFGAMTAAEAAGVPCAVVLVIASGGLVRPGDVAEPLRRLRARFDLSARRGVPPADLVLSPFPPSFRSPALPLPPGATSFARPVPPRRPRGPRPLVYFTLGTVFNRESGDLFERVLDGLEALDVDVVTTTGREVDPALLAPRAPRIRIERFVDHDEILPRADVVVCHGGSGTVIGALASGVPVLVLPMGADQSLNAERVAALDAGAALDALHARPNRIADVVAGLLADPPRGAATIANEYDGLPPVGAVVPALVELAGRS
ncbi:MGT family glycosyltransferase [Diaminobutyricimonas aerilata]|uniref:MGT family glycosyltransferase n=1 Tax=Diaminobutyricimonas aerilata TaxID=1162967 RepID=A0A2M9CFT6_9MICO|nr:glycosyltransferase [Diaminobutyricimonas aerilata]PJJ70796.1 MGT family glycosyltransferase [Diaminobutyricimonas aerilata]